MSAKLIILETPGFGEKGNKRLPYEDYLGEFVIVKTSVDSFGGMYTGMSFDGNMVFSPHAGVEYGSLGYKRIEMTNRDKQIPPSSITSIEVTTLKSLREYCMYANIDEVRKEQKETSEYLKTGLTLANQMLDIKKYLKQ